MISKKDFNSSFLFLRGGLRQALRPIDRGRGINCSPMRKILIAHL